uniref:Uncharacterized protein n=1 Tax=Glossina brevipalpis TaxID=37001 RepID=A0A1A9WBM5_9MUSC
MIKKVETLDPRRNIVSSIKPVVRFKLMNELISISFALNLEIFFIIICAKFKFNRMRAFALFFYCFRLPFIELLKKVKICAKKSTTEWINTALQYCIHNPSNTHHYDGV